MRQSVSLQQLANRTRCGDHAAAQTLRAELEARLRRIARQVVRANDGSSAVAVQILAEARRAQKASRGPASEGDLVSHVTRRVCAAAVDRLSPRRSDAAHMETVRA